MDIGHERIAIIVTGSRDWKDPQLIGRELDFYPGPDRTLLHGGARGADAIAALLAYARGWKVIEFKADWDSDGKAAGPIRNKAMLARLLHLQALSYQVCVEAFPLGKSIGTRHMMSIARKAGIRVYEHT